MKRIFLIYLLLNIIPMYGRLSIPLTYIDFLRNKNIHEEVLKQLDKHDKEKRDIFIVLLDRYNNFTNDEKEKFQNILYTIHNDNYDITKNDPYHAMARRIYALDRYVYIEVIMS